ncbi:MAG TPA: hypothetical protein VFD92_02560 [Candidatus Binatia bacterium]|nr:hypothetical protein [Candidatus Binatia bacterium]
MAPTTETCLYQELSGIYSPSASCEPLQQFQVRASQSFVARLGYAIAGDTAAGDLPAGVVKTCIRYVTSVGGYVTNSCSPPPPNIQDRGTLGYVFTSSAPGLIPVCQLQNTSSSRYRTSTQCPPASPPSGYTYLYTVGYVYSPTAAPPTTEIATLSTNALLASNDVKLHVSTQTLPGRERNLYAQPYAAYPVENTPRVVTLVPGGERTYLFSTAWTHRCRSQVSLLDRFVAYTTAQYDADCNLYISPGMLASIDDTGLFTIAPPPPGREWGRTYNAIWDAQIINKRIAPTLVASIIGQEENMKYFSDSALFLNVSKDEKVTDPVASTRNGIPCTDPSSGINYCVGGFVNGNLWHNGWYQFSSFTSLATATVPNCIVPAPGCSLMNAGALDEKGPVVWAQDGYYTLKTFNESWPVGTWIGNMTVAGGKIYLFYKTSNPSKRGVRPSPAPFENDQHCTTVALAKIKGSSVGAFRPYIKPLTPNGIGKFAASRPTLPAGFTKESINDFWDDLGSGGPWETGGGTDCLFDDNHGPLCDPSTDPQCKPPKASVEFKAVKVRGKRLWISVEERLVVHKAQLDGDPQLEDAMTQQVVLRVSHNPGRKWHQASEYVLEQGPIGGGWGSAKLTDPVFYDKNGEANDVVDPDDFWIVGNNPNANYGAFLQVYAVRLRLTFP